MAKEDILKINRYAFVTFIFIAMTVGVIFGYYLAHPYSHLDYQCGVNADSTCNCFVNIDNINDTSRFGLKNQYLNIQSNNDIYVCEKYFATRIIAESNYACSVSEKNVYPPNNGYFDVKCR